MMGRCNPTSAPTIQPTVAPEPSSAPTSSPVSSINPSPPPTAALPTAAPSDSHDDDDGGDDNEDDGDRDDDDGSGASSGANRDGGAALEGEGLIGVLVASAVVFGFLLGIAVMYLSGQRHSLRTLMPCDGKRKVAPDPDQTHDKEDEKSETRTEESDALEVRGTMGHEATNAKPKQAMARKSAVRFVEPKENLEEHRRRLAAKYGREHGES